MSFKHLLQNKVLIKLWACDNSQNSISIARTARIWKAFFILTMKMKSKSKMNNSFLGHVIEKLGPPLVKAALSPISFELKCLLN